MMQVLNPPAEDVSPLWAAKAPRSLLSDKLPSRMESRRNYLTLAIRLNSLKSFLIPTPVSLTHAWDVVIFGMGRNAYGRPSFYSSESSHYEIKIATGFKIHTAINADQKGILFHWR